MEPLFFSSCKYFFPSFSVFSASGFTSNCCSDSPRNPQNSRNMRQSISGSTSAIVGCKSS